MIPALHPANEFDRLNMLHGIDLLDTQPDPVLDELVACAATITDCPVSVLSLVDSDRQWFKAKVGTAITQTPRDVAFCAYTILGDELFEVVDAQADGRFVGSPLVTQAPHLRYYAGMPISVGGYQVGALCVMDVRPRQLGERERSAMNRLARTVSSWLGQHYLHQESVDTPANLYRRWSPVEVSCNRVGGFHLSLRSH